MDCDGLTNNNNNNNSNNNIIQSEKLFEKRYIDLKNEFTSFQILFQPYQLEIEKKIQRFENELSGNKEIINELNNNIQQERSEKQHLIKQIKDIHSMVLLMKNKLDASEKEIKVLNLKNEELILDLQLLRQNSNNNK
ncbi:hypothetical protein RB653_005152 [Dictyostelium firmibasis]|uniref:Uncharacterized protein n=1 Tax=Dictyostelium firmibasis TaxID=79012 RepID=A0AAN7U8X2_9MYCE